MKNKIPYKRVLLKLSGEILMGSKGYGIDPETCQNLAFHLSKIKLLGIQLSIVIGGGNIFRGIDPRGSEMPRTPADHMGMLATILNGIALQQALLSHGCQACAMSALECPKAVETYNWNQALKYQEQGTVLIFVGGTGNPYFTTDTAAALRASEIKADLLLKATKVDGIYDKDPVKYAEAKKYSSLTHSQMLAEKLMVMDATAVALCRSNQIPLFVFNMQKLFQNNLEEIFTDFSHGTFVQE